MPATNFRVAEYGDVDGYWTPRYRDESRLARGGFEWYSGTEELMMAALKRHVAPPAATARVMDYGCGSSALAVTLAAAGYSHVVALDGSQFVIDQQQAKLSALSSDVQAAVSYVVRDCCDLSEYHGTFDALLDKATLDALDCAGSTEAALRQISLALKPGGLYILATCRDPSERLAVLQPSFEVLEIVDLPDAACPTSPCAAAHVLCLRLRSPMSRDIASAWAPQP